VRRIENNFIYSVFLKMYESETSKIKFKTEVLIYHISKGLINNILYKAHK